MKLKSVVTILLVVGTLVAFALVSTTPLVAAEKKTTAKETVKKVEKSTKKAKKKVAKAVESAKALPKEKININAAGMEDLMMLPGIGEVKAEAIMKARKKLKFNSVDDLIGVPGIGAKTAEAIKPYLKFK